MSSTLSFAQKYEVSFKNNVPYYLTIDENYSDNKVEVISGLGCYQSVKIFPDYIFLDVCLSNLILNSNEPDSIFYPHQFHMKKEINLSFDNNGEMSIRLIDLLSGLENKPYENEHFTEILKIKKI